MTSHGPTSHAMNLLGNIRPPMSRSDSFNYRIHHHASTLLKTSDASFKHVQLYGVLRYDIKSTATTVASKTCKIDLLQPQYPPKQNAKQIVRLLGAYGRSMIP